MTAWRRIALTALLAATGSCVPVRYADCGSGTVRPADDPNHCGGCHVSCPEGVSCVGGRCAIPAGATVCRDGEAPEGAPPPWRRPEEAACGTGDPTFTQEFGPLRCRVADLASDPLHCGACGHACASDERCVDGGCVPCCPDSP